MVWGGSGLRFVSVSAGKAVTGVNATLFGSRRGNPMSRFLSGKVLSEVVAGCFCLLYGSYGFYGLDFAGYWCSKS